MSSWRTIRSKNYAAESGSIASELAEKGHEVSIEPRFQQGFVEALFEAASIGLGLVDRDLNYVKVNEALAAINGKSAAEHEGRPIREVIPEFADYAEGLLRQVMDTQVPILNFELSGGTPGNPDADRHFLLSYYPILAEGDVIGVGAVVVEETERVRGQRELTQQAHIIFEEILQQLVVVKLSLETGDNAKAHATTEKALESARRIASSVLPSQDSE